MEPQLSFDCCLWLLEVKPSDSTEALPLGTSVTQASSSVPHKNILATPLVETEALSHFEDAENAGPKNAGPQNADHV